METRTPYLGRDPEPADALDRDSFYEQHSAVMARFGDAVDSGYALATADCIAELGVLRAANPLHTRELETRWEATDADL